MRRNNPSLVRIVPLIGSPATMSEDRALGILAQEQSLYDAMWEAGALMDGTQAPHIEYDRRGARGAAHEAQKRARQWS